MPSPFPGMDPYLEDPDAWQDFHHRYTTAMAGVLGPQLRPRYHVRMEENVYIRELPAEERRLLGRPNAMVIEANPGSHVAASARTATVAAPEYFEMPLAIDIRGENFLSIVETKSRRVITVIELLSPSNKRPGADRDQYERKRRQVMHSDANLVEIDLLRQYRLPVTGLGDRDYYALVSRTQERPRFGLWAFTLRDKMPEIAVPVSAGDPDAFLDLRAPLDEVYERAAYADYIYLQPPVPPLDPASQAWAKKLIAAQ